ncbi:MAG: cytochrome P450 [Solirubrobacterales bacterium]
MAKATTTAEPPNSAELPPGPAGPTLAATVRFQRDPLAVLLRAREEFGPVFTLQTTFAGPIVAVAEPAAVVDLLGADPAAARAGEARRAILPQASTRSVLGGDDSVHRAHRAALAATFTPEPMERRREAIAALARRHAAAWPRDRPVQLLSRMRTLVDDVFVRVVLGIRDEDRARATIRALGAMLRTPGNPPLPPPGPDQGLPGALGQRLFERRRRRLAAPLEAEIAARRGRGERGGGDRDAIAALLAADPQPAAAEIVEELVTLMMAGQEPPAIALAWTLDRLARHPGLGADYLAAGAEAPLREAVWREALRLRGPSLGALRRLRAPLRAGEHELPAGTNAMVALPLVHRDPRAFPDPEVFRPARWLPLAEPPLLYMPFGGGGRRCLGERLAGAEAAAVIPAVLEAVRLRPLWPRSERMVQRGTVLVPHRSLPVWASPSSG